MSKCLLDAYTGHPTDWRHSLQFAASRIGPLLWLAILAEVLLTIAFILLVIPGIYLLVCWTLALPVLMFEGIGGYGALRRSRELIGGTGGRRSARCSSGSSRSSSSTSSSA